MRKLLERLNAYRQGVNKYYITLIIFAVITFFVGDSTLLQRVRYDAKIRELQSEIKDYRRQIDENKERLNSLRMDDESLERFAREQFFMTRSDEDLFIITP